MANVLTTPKSQDSAAGTTREVAVAKTRTERAKEIIGSYLKNVGRISMIDSKDYIGTSSFIESMGGGV